MRARHSQKSLNRTKQHSQQPKVGYPTKAACPELAGDPPRNWEPVWRGRAGGEGGHGTGSGESKNTKTTGDCSESLVIWETESATVKYCFTPRTTLGGKKRK